MHGKGASLLNSDQVLQLSNNWVTGIHCREKSNDTVTGKMLSVNNRNETFVHIGTFEISFTCRARCMR
jgi:hypothetical protein